MNNVIIFCGAVTSESSHSFMLFYCWEHIRWTVNKVSKIIDFPLLITSHGQHKFKSKAVCTLLQWSSPAQHITFNWLFINTHKLFGKGDWYATFFCQCANLTFVAKDKKSLSERCYHAKISLEGRCALELSELSSVMVFGIWYGWLAPPRRLD